MKTAIAAIIFLAIATPALAQDKPSPPSGFEPFVVTEQDWQKLQAWLNEQPYKFTQPVITWAQELENRALAKKAADKPPAKVD